LSSVIIHMSEYIFYST